MKSLSSLVVVSLASLASLTVARTAAAQSAAPEAPVAPEAQSAAPTAPNAAPVTPQPGAAPPTVVATPAQTPTQTPAQTAAPTPGPAPRETIYAVQFESASARYRAFSYSLLGGATLGAGYSPTINTTVGADLALATELRVLYRGVVIAGSLGAKVTGVSLPMAPTGAALGVLLVPGVGGGYQFRVTPSLSIGAVARYNLSALITAIPQFQHTISLDAPVTIHVGRNGIIEPYAQVGVAIGGLSTTGGAATSTQVTAIISGGLRFGVTL